MVQVEFDDIVDFKRVVEPIEWVGRVFWICSDGALSFWMLIHADS